MTTAKSITLNGAPVQTEAETVAALIVELGLPNKSVLVEHNGTALRPDEWQTPLADGDRIELMRIVAGG